MHILPLQPQEKIIRVRDLETSLLLPHCDLVSNDCKTPTSMQVAFIYIILSIVFLALLCLRSLYRFSTSCIVVDFYFSDLTSYILFGRSPFFVLQIIPC